MVVVADFFGLLFVFLPIVDFRIKPILTFMWLEISLIEKTLDLSLRYAGGYFLQMNFIGQFSGSSMGDRTIEVRWRHKS